MLDHECTETGACSDNGNNASLFGNIKEMHLTSGFVVSVCFAVATMIMLGFFHAVASSREIKSRNEAVQTKKPKFSLR